MIDTTALIRWLVLFLALAVCAPARALEPDRRVSQYAHSAWRLQDGFLGAVPYSIAQTKDGYMWIGTQSGIKRFDGVRFVDWAPPGGEQIRSGFVYRLLATDDGSLWMGIEGLGLWRWKDDHLSRYLADVPMQVMAIVDGGAGSVWVALLNGRDQTGAVCEVASERTHCYGEESGLPHTCCVSLATDRRGQFWVVGLYEVVNWRPPFGGRTLLKTPGPPQPGDNLFSIALAPNGEVLLGNLLTGPHTGLQRSSPRGWKPLEVAKWDSSRVSTVALSVDRHQTIWIGSSTQGLYRVQGASVDHFGTEDGLSSNTVFAIYEDQEGSIWVATRKGLDCFKDLAVVSTSKREGLSGDEVDSVTASRDGTVWVGLDAIRGTNIVPLKPGRALRALGTTSVYEDGNRNFYVGAGTSLSVLKHGKFIPIRRPNGAPFGFVTSMAEDANNHIWAETGRPRELLEISHGHVVRTFPAPQTPAARWVAVDHQGSVWLGLFDGNLARYQKGKLDVFPFPHGNDPGLRGLTVARDGSVLGATATGLIGWREGKGQRMTMENGLPCGVINALLEDRSGSLWLYMQCGLVRIRRQEVERWWREPKLHLITKTYDSLDGVQPGRVPFQGAAEGVDGRLWFANGSSVQMIDPNHLVSNPVVPPVHVEEIVIRGQSVPLSRNPVLPASARDIAIRYTGLSFVSPQRVLFRYKLEGQDSVWQEAGTRREAFYTNLAPGSYRFRVSAANNDGIWNEVGDSFSFRIAPAYYQTSWFAFVCCLGIICILSLLYLMRIKQAQAQVEQKLGARLEERERISRELHDTLLQGFQGLMLRFQAVIKVLPPDQPGRQMLESVLDRADEVLLEGRQSVRDLRVGNPVEELSELISRCGQELAQNYDIPFSLEFVGSVSALKAEVCDEAFRIIREALFNAFQHSCATNIEAEVTYSSSEVRVSVRDNGVGMSAELVAAGRPEHWGVKGMRERAQRIHSNLDIWSTPGAGTEVVLKIPSVLAHLQIKKVSMWSELRMYVARQRRSGQWRTK